MSRPATSTEPVGAPPNALEPDTGQLARFFKELFLYASLKNVVSLRVFRDDRSNAPPVTIQSIPLDGGSDRMIDEIVKVAAQAGRTAYPAVFCSPLATFRGEKASEAELAQGLVLTVECDAHATAAREYLSSVLGPPTVTVASGGVWTDPATGHAEENLHLHWRLREPTTTPAGHTKLKRARAIACELVGADASAKSIVHPLRWPGSWHRKGEPRLARIVEGTDNEIDLGPTLEELEGLALMRGFDSAKARDTDTSEHDQRAKTPLSGDDLVRCAAGIANDAAVPWEEWNRIGMAFWRASGGSEDGFAAFDRWSQKSGKYEAEATRARWEHYRSSPPTRIGAGTLIYLARLTDRTSRPEGSNGHQRGDNGSGDDAARTAAAASEDNREVIELRAQWKNAVLDRSAELLRDEIFLRGQLPVIVMTLAEDTELYGVRHQRGGAIAAQATADHLQYRLDGLTKPVVYDEKKKRFVAKEYPRRYAAELVGAAAIIGKFRPLFGIVRAPLFDPKTGEITETPGYDERTGLFLDWNGTLPPIPGCPTKAEAIAALDRLILPFRGYAGKVDPVAIVAAVLTAAIRPTLPTAPAITIDGNGPGCGKGLFARTVTAIATGGPPATITEGDKAEELEKRLSAAIISGAPVILLDNLQRQLASSALESGLTEANATTRNFGTLQNLTMPWRALVLISANNASLRRDLLRRAVPVRIVVDTDDPERLQYDFDPVAEVLRDREELLAAAFTLLRATLNEKPETPTLGSFAPWAALVGGACRWLLGRSPVDLIMERKAQDPQLAGERAVLEALAEAYPNGAVFRAEDGAKNTSIPWADAPRLHLTDDGMPTAKALGAWLGYRKDQVFGPLKLSKVTDDKRKIGEWKIERVNP